ncbi:MAG: TlpA disulfide reductase family protein, partial [Gemmatimonadales bacterium]|nr:TlpA disulfide reductase family protein [Gemmatimonadales bacterium]
TGASRPGVPTLALDAELPARGRVLWLDGRTSVPGGKSVAVRDSAGRVLLVDDRLRVREAALPGDIASIVSAAPAGDGGVWVVDGTGRLLRVTAESRIAERLGTPFRLPAIGDVGHDGRLTLVRASQGFPFAFDTSPAAPVAVMDTFGRGVHSYGIARRPAHVLLTDLANAGHAARAGSRTFFAPLVRDEVVAFGAAGDTLWSLRRGLPRETPDPRFELRDHRPVLNYFPVNLGLALGPDGRLYVLSTADTTLSRSRLDVLDPADGRSLGTFFLPTILPTIVVTPAGRIDLIPAARLLARVEGAERPAVPAFNWPQPDGGRVTEGALRGRVTIVNAWASWCAPCREEMPELVGLWTSLRDSGLALLTVNEDLNQEDARRWLDARRLAPPVALAAGEGRGVLHYPGLPYTILVDRSGRIARRWIGYAGPRQISDIAAAARHELGFRTAHTNATLPSARHDHAAQP